MAVRSAFDTAWDLVKAPYHGTTLSRAKKILEEGGKPMKPRIGDPRFYMTPDELEARAYAASRSINAKEPPALLYIDDDHIDSRDDVEDLGWNNLAVGHVDPKHITMVDDSEEELAGKEINEESMNEAGWFIHRGKNQDRASDKRIWEQKPPEGFNKAFALLKMPYHGTNEEAAKKILRYGTRAFKDKRPTFRQDPARFWMTNDPKEALRHARIKGAKPSNEGYWDDDYRQSGFSRPVILHITDEGVNSVPHHRRKAFRDMDYITHRHPHRIDPKHISVFAEGPEPNISPLFDWGDDYGESLSDEESKRGREADIARKKEIEDYRQSVWNWRPDFDERL